MYNGVFGFAILALLAGDGLSCKKKAQEQPASNPPGLLPEFINGEFYFQHVFNVEERTFFTRSFFEKLSFFSSPVTSKGLAPAGNLDAGEVRLNNVVFRKFIGKDAVTYMDTTGREFRNTLLLSVSGNKKLEPFVGIGQAIFPTLENPCSLTDTLYTKKVNTFMIKGYSADQAYVCLALPPPNDTLFLPPSSGSFTLSPENARLLYAWSSFDWEPNFSLHLYRDRYLVAGGKVFRVRCVLVFEKAITHVL